MTARVFYVAGPMSGCPDFNYPAFNAVAAELRAAGHTVENPAENTPPACGSWLGYMRQSLVQIARADVVLMLPGWYRSKGATIEHGIAKNLGIPVEYYGVKE